LEIICMPLLKWQITLLVWIITSTSELMAHFPSKVRIFLMTTSGARMNTSFLRNCC
jgi:hypothetical protein